MQLEDGFSTGIASGANHNSTIIPPEIISTGCGSGNQLGEAESFGLIAQEAEKLLPELITEDSRGYKAVRYNLLPLMTLQAMKEQQDQIKTLQAENTDLKARLERLERAIGAYAFAAKNE